LFVVQLNETTFLLVTIDERLMRARVELEDPIEVVIFPGAKPVAVSQEVTLSQADIEEMFKDRRRLYVRSLTKYCDVFDQPHETSLCIFLGGPELKPAFVKWVSTGAAGVPTGFDIAARYNEAD
jgi:hypothetical protein